MNEMPDSSLFQPGFDQLTPKAIVAALDRHIVGQTDAKKAVAVALRNRWRRQQLPADLRDEVTPKNILMIGPTGCGKTEISRRLAKLADAPFLKIEATKFTEVGYVGRDVDSIIRDLVEESIRLTRNGKRANVREAAEKAALDRLLDALVGKDASEATRLAFRDRLFAGALKGKEIEIEVEDGAPQMPFDLPGMPPGSVGMINLGDMLGKAMGKRTKRRRMPVEAAWEQLVNEESDKRLDTDDLTREAVKSAEANGIVFLDEIDKIAISDVRGGSVSREGVQRDLLPLIEGTTVATKYGPVKTDHILFIASGAFHVAKPSDLLPELQGRLPIRVELKGLTQADFKRILTDTEASLTRQYVALMATEGVALSFTDDGIDAIARIAAEVNDRVENIGARRLSTVMEKLLEDLSFEAADGGEASRSRSMPPMWTGSCWPSRGTMICRSSFSSPGFSAGGDRCPGQPEWRAEAPALRVNYTLTRAHHGHTIACPGKSESGNRDTHVDRMIRLSNRKTLRLGGALQLPGDCLCRARSSFLESASRRGSTCRRRCRPARAYWALSALSTGCRMIDLLVSRRRSNCSSCSARRRAFPFRKRCRRWSTGFRRRSFRRFRRPVERLLR